jgi:hypothetical protein
MDRVRVEGAEVSQEMLLPGKDPDAHIPGGRHGAKGLAQGNKAVVHGAYGNKERGEAHLAQFGQQFPGLVRVVEPGTARLHVFDGHARLGRPGQHAGQAQGIGQGLAAADMEARRAQGQRLGATGQGRVLVHVSRLTCRSAPVQAMRTSALALVGGDEPAQRRRVTARTTSSLRPVRRERPRQRRPVRRPWHLGPGPAHHPGGSIR